MPKLLCIDEVGYLSYNVQQPLRRLAVRGSHATVQRAKPVLLSTKAFSEWSEVLKAKELTAARTKQRSKKQPS